MISAHKIIMLLIAGNIFYECLPIQVARQRIVQAAQPLMRQAGQSIRNANMSAGKKAAQGLEKAANKYGQLRENASQVRNFATRVSHAMGESIANRADYTSRLIGFGIADTLEAIESKWNTFRKDLSQLFSHPAPAPAHGPAKPYRPIQISPVNPQMQPSSPITLFDVMTNPNRSKLAVIARAAKPKKIDVPMTKSQSQLYNQLRQGTMGNAGVSNATSHIVTPYNQAVLLPKPKQMPSIVTPQSLRPQPPRSPLAIPTPNKPPVPMPHPTRNDPHMGHLYDSFGVMRGL